MARTRRSTISKQPIRQGLRLPSSRAQAEGSSAERPQGRQSTNNSAMPSFAVEPSRFQFPSLNKRTVIIAIIVIGLLALGFYQKQWFIAATVNGSPILNTEVLARINAQYREQTLTQMINEKLILDEAKKQRVVVSQNEIDERIAQIEQEVGGAQALEGLLLQQRQTRADLRNQLGLQLTIGKLYASESSVSAEEIDKFVAENKDKLTSTESAKQRNEAEQILKQQKLSTVFNEKFQLLKEAAKITIF